MIILALDLGTTTGWAIRDGTGQIVSGSQQFRHTRYEGGGMRFLRFVSWLNEMLTFSGAIDALFYEEIRAHKGVDAAHVYGGLLSTLQQFCELQDPRIPYSGVPVGTIKRHATGKGNASKAMVIDAMKGLGHRPSDDNEADALALLHWSLDPVASNIHIPHAKAR